MKYRVNLYPDDLKPRVELFTLQFALLLWGVSFLIIVVGSVWTQANTSHWQQQLEQQQQTVKEFRQALVKQRQKQDEGPSPDLVRQVRRMQEQAREQRALLQQLDKLEGRNNLGLGSLMMALAKADHSQVWLSQIRVSGQQLYLRGHMARASVLPQWLEQLSAQPTIRGREFIDASLYEAGDKGLSFALNTGLELDNKTGGSR